MEKIIAKNKILMLFPLLILLLSACSAEIIKFEAGDIKDDFCGTHLNYQYCKCAFDNNFCEQVAMSKSEAKKYVNEEYDKWVNKERQNFSNQCKNDGGIYKEGECEYCSEGKVAVDGKCEKEIVKENINKEDEHKGLVDGSCKYDTDCDTKCVDDIKWIMTCNTGTNICENAFDTNCRSNMETFGDLSFPMVCSVGDCVRDKTAIVNKGEELGIEKKKNKDDLDKLNIRRDSLKKIMSEMDNNCSNSSVDIDNVSIVEFVDRVTSIVSDDAFKMASVSLESASKVLDKLNAYVKEDTLTAKEYKKINCDLQDYFKVELENNDSEIDRLVETAQRINDSLKSLPVL